VPGQISGLKLDSYRLPTVKVSDLCSHPQKRYWAELVVLAFITLLTYANTFQDTDFVRDNDFLVLQDARVHSASLENLQQIFTQDYWQVSGGGATLYRPLTTLSYLFNYAILGNGTHATGYHLFNALLHTINVILVYLLIRALPGTGGMALLVAAIFAVHPINVETVTNIVGRADLLAAGSVLVAFLCYLRAVAVPGRQKIFWLASMMLVVTLGLFCKETAIVILVVVVLYDFTYRLRPLHRNKLANLWLNFWDFFRSGYIALIFPLLIFFVVRYLVFYRVAIAHLPFVVFIDNPLREADFWSARLTAVKVIGKYLWIFLWPRLLSNDYSYNQIPLIHWPFQGWEDWQVMVVIALVVALVWLAVKQRQNRKELFFCLFWLFGAMLPTANLLPRPGAPIFENESWLIGSIMAERFMYLPSIGYAGCLVIAVQALGEYIAKINMFTAGYRLKVTKMVGAVLLGVVVLSLAFRSFQRNYDWENEYSLWSKDVVSVPNNVKAHMFLAKYADSVASGNNVDLAISEAEQALAITDRFMDVLLNLGIFYRQKGNSLAERSADAGWLLGWQSMVWYEKSANILQQAILLDKALNAEQQARLLRSGIDARLIWDNGELEVYFQSGDTLALLGRFQAALNAYRDMRHLAPFDLRSYREMVKIFRVVNDLPHAAISLHQLQWLDDRDLEIGRELIEVYKQMDPQGCAVDKHQPQATLNPACPLVQQTVCQANFELVDVLVQAKQFETAWQMVQTGIRECHCLPALYVPLLPPGTNLDNLAALALPQ